MLAALSPEVKIKNGLRELNCAEYIFARIAGVVGKTRLAEGLAGQRGFERRDAEKMLEVLQEMQELQAAVGVPIDWSRVDKVQIALTVRRVAKFAAETSDHRMNEAANVATQNVR